MSTSHIEVRWLQDGLSVGLNGERNILIGRLSESEAGFKASEFLLLSLGGCFNSTLAQAVSTRNFKLVKLNTQVQAETLENPRRFGELTVVTEVEILNSDGKQLGEEELDKLVAIAERGCFVTNTLRPNIDVSFRRNSSLAAIGQ